MEVNERGAGWQAGGWAPACVPANKSSTTSRQRRRSRESSTRFNDFCARPARAWSPSFLYFPLRKPGENTKTAESARTSRSPLHAASLNVYERQAVSSFPSLALSFSFPLSLSHFFSPASLRVPSVRNPFLFVYQTTLRLVSSFFVLLQFHHRILVRSSIKAAKI